MINISTNFLSILKYEDALMNVENITQEKIFYFLENPKELNLQIAQAKNLRKEILSSDLPNYYKTKMIEKIDNNLSYLKRIYLALEKNKEIIVPLTIFSFLFGMCIGVGIKYKFDCLAKKFDKNIKDTIEKEILIKLNQI